MKTRTKFRAAVVIVMMLQSLVSLAVDKWSDVGRYDLTWYDASKNIYEITNGNELAGVAYLVNNGYTTFAGKTIRITEDIVLSNRLWVPIGRKGLPFCGTFDGGYKEIKNIQIERNSVGSPYVYYGLFGYIQNATIKDLVLSGNINFQIENYYPEQYIGSIAAYAEGSTMNNCLSTVKINYDRTHASNNKYYVYIGGVVGKGRENIFESCHYKSDIAASIYRGLILDSEYYTGGRFFVAGLCADDYYSVFKYCSSVMSEFDVHVPGTVNETMSVTLAGLIGMASYSDINSCNTIIDNVKYTYYTSEIVTLSFAGIANWHSFSVARRKGIHNCYAIVNKMKNGTGTVRSNVSYGSIACVYEDYFPQCYTSNYGNSDIVIDCASLPCYRKYDGMTTFTGKHMRTQEFVDELNLYFTLNGKPAMWHMGGDGYPVIGWYGPTGIKERSVAHKEVVKKEYITLDGKVVTRPSKGVYILKKTYNDRTTSLEKILKH